MHTALERRTANSELLSAENSEKNDETQDGTPKEEEVKKNRMWYDWLKEAQFYIFGFVYMFARMALNCTATMMPLYLTSCTGFVE